MKMMFASSEKGVTTPMHRVEHDNMVSVFEQIDKNPGLSFGKSLYHAIHGEVPESTNESWSELNPNLVELTVSWNGKANKKFTCWLG